MVEAVAVAPRRVPTAVRHDHSPESITRRRSRSIGFHKSQTRQHDATERRHERPGAEAALAGQYLIGHRGERLDDDYDYEYHGNKRDRHYEEGINRDFEQRSRPYSPQRAPSPERERERDREVDGERDEAVRERRHRRHRRRHRHRDERERERERDDDDERSYVSEHYRKVEREYRD